MAEAAMAERVRIPGGRVTGKVLQWKGKFGWIKPSAQLDHPEAAMHAGKVYLAQEDLETTTLSVGDSVSFFVYADGGGLGAQHCRAAGGATPQQKPAKGSGKGATQKGLAWNSPSGAKGIVKGNAPKVQQKPAKGSGKGATQKGLAWNSPSGAKGIVKGNAPKVQYAQRVAKTTTKAVQQKYVAVPKGQVGSVKKGQVRLQPTAKSMPSPEGITGPATGPPDKTNRQRITKRIGGTLHKWRGSVGWIKPAESVEGAGKRGLYVHEVDVQQGNDMQPGAAVTFFVYQDDAGIGAEHVIVVGNAPPQAGAKAGKPPFMPKAVKSLLPKPKAKGQGKGTVAGKMMTKLKSRQRGKGGGEKKEPAGPGLPRNRITAMPVSGEVVEWKGKFGWVTSTEVIESEHASKRDGKIYIHSQDVIGSELAVGQTVEFHVYEDSSGLGAEECQTL